jgi:hypothetical protein
LFEIIVFSKDVTELINSFETYEKKLHLLPEMVAYKGLNILFYDNRGSRNYNKMEKWYSLGLDSI